MKIRFEEVGRNKETWTAEYPITAELGNVAADVDWWPRQLRRALRSDPEWAYDPVADCVWIYAGWYRVGRAVVVEEVQA